MYSSFEYALYKVVDVDMFYASFHGLLEIGHTYVEKYEAVCAHQ